MEFDGDEYAENDYGIVVDSSSDVMQLDQKLDAMGQAALQNKLASLSDVMRMYTSACSLSEKIRILQKGEQRARQQAVQDQQAQMQSQQQIAQANFQAKQMEIESQMKMNSEDNETKVLIAQIQAEAKLNATAMQRDDEEDGIFTQMTEEAKQKLKEQIREFDLKIQQDNKKLELEHQKIQAARSKSNTSKQ